MIHQIFFYTSTIIICTYFLLKTETEDANLTTTTTIVIVIVLALFILIIAGILFLIFRKKKQAEAMKYQTVHLWVKNVIIVKSPVDTMNPETMQIPIVKIEKEQKTVIQTPTTAPYTFTEYEVPLDSDWEISRNKLLLGPTLGAGEFGRVVRAKADGLNNSSGCLTVAVKMIKEDHTDTDMASLVQEMEIMKIIRKHVNIINLLGCCSQDGPLYVIVEYAPHGNLKDFLNKNCPTSKVEMGNDNDRKEILQKDLKSYALQVGRGMVYLASRKVLIADLWVI